MDMKSALHLAACCWLAFGSAQAQEPTTPEAPQPETVRVSKPDAAAPTLVTGIVKKHVFMGKELTSYCSRGTDKFTDEGALLVVAGYETCKRTYSDPKGFYTVYRGLQKYYVEEADLTLSEQDAQAIKALAGEEKEAFARHANMAAIALRQRELTDVMDTLKRHRKSGVMVVSSSIADESEHTEGTSFSIEVINPGDKPIKYVWFTVVGYNAVGDPVRSKFGASSTVKAIGPIAPSASASYEWKYLWFTDIVETFKVPKIKVQYMDGSTGEVQNVKAVTLSAAHRKLLKEFEES